MENRHVTLRINSTFYDLFGEYLLFIKEVYPEVKRICQKHNIDIDYEDTAFSVPKENFTRRIILQDLRCIDSDRTIFICFRGQKIGWRPCPDDIDRFTLNEYPELVDFIGSVSITELAIMHALKPFDKCVDGELIQLNPVKHALFYFRKSNYLNDITNPQKLHYINKSNGMDAVVLDMEIAKAKDLIYETKREFEGIDNFNYRVNIAEYDAKWNSNLNIENQMMEYTHEYEKLKGESLDYFVGIHKEYLPDEKQGGLCDFKYGNTSLKDIMVEDILNAIRIEFLQNF